MPGIELETSFSPPVLIAILLAVIALSVFLYRYTIPQVSTPKRILLATLRGMSLTLMIILLVEPVLRTTTTSRIPPSVAVFVDDSQSMDLVDGRGDRKSAVRTIIQSLLEEQAPPRLLWYGIGGKTHSIPPPHPDSINPDDDGTNLASALQELDEVEERENIVAAVFITDGVYTVGSNPVHHVEAVTSPLFTVPIGDSAQHRDVSITRISANSIVYAGVETPVDVSMRTPGYAGKRIEVVLREGSKEIARQWLESGGDETAERTARLHYTPEGEGVRRLSAHVSQFPGELSTGNNTRQFFVSVLRSKLRIVMIAGAPSPDLAVLRQTLIEENTYTVTSFSQKADAGFREGRPAQQTLDSADCFILINFPTSATTGGFIATLREYLIARTKPVLFIAGPSLDGSKLAELGPVLPFSMTEIGRAEEQVFMERIPEALHHPILQTGYEDAWKRLPPIFRTDSRVRTKSEATVLAVTRIQGVVTREPLVLSRHVARSRSLAILGHGVWRWRLMAQGNEVTERFLSTLLANSIRWLTSPDEHKAVRIAPEKQAMLQNEIVRFMGQVYDASSSPVDQARVEVSAVQGERSYQVLMRSLGNGRYEGELAGIPPGEYTYAGTATIDGTVLGTDRGKFSVGELGIEFQDTRMNASLLRRLSEMSGGEFMADAGGESIMEAIRRKVEMKDVESTTITKLELWRWQYSLAAIVLLLSMEWFVRKRSGML